MIVRYSAIFILITLFAGYSASQIPAGRWRVTYLRGVNLGRSEPYVDIDPDGKKFTGNTGCNIMNGNVAVHARSVQFNTVITTKARLHHTYGNGRGRYAPRAAKGTSISNREQQARLYDGNRLMMEFEPISPPAAEEELKPVADQIGLGDRKWVLQSIAGSAIPKVQETAFIVFNTDKGSAGGNTSCNAFGADYEENGEKMSITQEISTIRACIEDKRMDIERGFLDGLQRANRYEIRGLTLNLYHDRKLLLTFVGKRQNK